MQKVLEVHFASSTFLQVFLCPDFRQIIGISIQPSCLQGIFPGKIAGIHAKTPKAAWLTFTTTYGLTQNTNAQSLVHNSLTMAALVQGKRVFVVLLRKSIVTVHRLQGKSKRVLCP